MHTVKRRLAQTIPPSDYLSLNRPRYYARSYTRNSVIPFDRKVYLAEELESFGITARGHDISRIQADRRRRHQLALLIAAHDEALVIEKTINSAIEAGLSPEHIFVVDDCSSDATSEIARSILGPLNVCRLARSGKGSALTKGAKKFTLTQRYRWIHIADADGMFSPNYFRIMRRNLRLSYAAATGYVSSLPGGTVSQFRVFEYTIGMEIHRRFQAMTGTINVIPGPTSCFRYDVFAKINFDNKSLTEDLDVTLQIHRQKLGKIQFIPSAVAFTQDPKTMRDYINQITRWDRGVLQSMLRHKVGRRLHRLDAYMSYQVLQNLIMLFNYGLLLPILALMRHSASVLALTFLIDVGLTFWLTFLVAFWARRYDIISAFPQIYFYRWVSLAVFLKAFAEVVVLRRFRIGAQSAVWETANRRYVSDTEV